jgi:hypothetical protein
MYNHRYYLFIYLFIIIIIIIVVVVGLRKNKMYCNFGFSHGTKRLTTQHDTSIEATSSRSGTRDANDDNGNNNNNNTHNNNNNNNNNSDHPTHTRSRRQLPKTLRRLRKGDDKAGDDDELLLKQVC